MRTMMAGPMVKKQTSLTACALTNCLVAAQSDAISTAAFPTKRLTVVQSVAISAATSWPT